MSVTKNHVYAILTAIALVAAYFLFSTLPPPKLEFRDRAFPRGFRELVLGSASSQIDPLFGLQRSPRPPESWGPETAHRKPPANLAPMQQRKPR